MVKNPPTMWETWIRSLGWEDPLKEVMATHSSILAWRIPWTEQPGRLQSMGSQRVKHNWATQHTLIIYPNKNRKELRERNWHMPEAEKWEGKTVHRQKHTEHEGQEGLSVNKGGNPGEARLLAALPHLGVWQILAWTRTSAFMPRHDPKVAS